MISKEELLYFVQITKTLNFSRAAARIGISQPSLSAGVKRLETAIGTPLFIRHKKGVILTTAGEHLLRHVKQLLHDWEMLKSRALVGAQQLQGTVIVGCHPSMALSCLAEFLPEFLQKYPQIELQFKHDLSRKIMELIMDFSVDIGLIVNPMRHPGLIIQKLYTDEVGFWQALKPTSLQKLAASQTVILYDDEMMQAQWLLKKMQKKQKPSYRSVISGSIELIANLCAKGAGIAVLPTCVAERYSLKRVPNTPILKDEVCLVYRPETKDVATIRTLVNAIKSYFQSRSF